MRKVIAIKNFSLPSMFLAVLLALAVFQPVGAQTVYKSGKAPARENSEPLRVIFIGAHPDDAEGRCGGTAALWAEQGAEVMLVSVTNGDAGHQSQGGGALARRRAAESRRSAKILGVSWQTLDFHDGELVPSLQAREAVIRAIRNWKADIVISHRPNDYHPDHRYTGQLVQDAAYLVIVPNICPDTPRLERNPVFMYSADRFQKPYPFVADVVVDIGAVIEKKIAALAEMDSQMFEWLPWIGGSLSEVPQGKEERLAWYRQRRLRGRKGRENSYYQQVAARYGKARADSVQFVEVFELCEYGRQPDRQELWELFPK
jgi:LmbE family N-acetylglucosaminyl deacetylase